MQNNVKLLAVRNLPGSVLLGGTRKEAPGRGVGVRIFTSKEGRAVVSILGKGSGSLSVLHLGWVCLFLPFLFRSPGSLVLAGRYCTMPLAAGRMMWSISP